MEFVAVDVETANPNLASICQIGAAIFRHGNLVREWVSLVNPEDWFSGSHVGIHGITRDMVEKAPTMPQLVSELREMLENRIVISHTPFDRLAINRAFTAHNEPPLKARWLDSARVARRTWKEVSRQGYGLANVCRLIGYEFKHHNALEDAKAAGQVMLAAMQETGLGLVEWISRVEQPITRQQSARRSVTRSGNPNGPLFGEVVVFTGALKIVRREAADLADSIGCAVGANVTRCTTMLVVGDKDVSGLTEHDKSSKHRRAEELIAEGHSVRIIGETDFMAMIDLYKEKAT